MNPLLEKYMKDKYGENYEGQANSDYSQRESNINAGATMSAFGDALAGRAPGSQNDYFQGLKKQAKEDTIGKLDKAKNQFAADYDMDRNIKEDSAKDEQTKNDSDPNHANSKIAQSLFIKMGGNPEQAKGLTAAKFKGISGSMEKIYKIEQDKQTRQDAKSAKNEAKLAANSAGQSAVDKDYARDYNDFTGGGETKAKDAIKKLREYQVLMSKDDGYVQAGGGPIAGSMPDAFRTQQSIAQRDNIVSTANSALKATFGGQLSDGERKALANEFYNDKLSNKENLKIIERKIAELENGLMTQKQKAQYFENNRGTLSNFRSGKPGEKQKTVVKRQVNQKTGQTRVVYDDGTVELENQQAGL